VVKHFEDLIAWQKARELANSVYSVTREPMFAKDFALSSQIRRAAISVMSNTAEGFERSTTKEFLRFLHIAKASCAEVRSHLTIARDIGYLKEPEYRRIKMKAVEVSRILAGLCASISRVAPK
jgi:four helix bundle protein